MNLKMIQFNKCFQAQYENTFCWLLKSCIDTFLSLKIIVQWLLIIFFTIFYEIFDFINPKLKSANLKTIQFNRFLRPSMNIWFSGSSNHELIPFLPESFAWSNDLTMVKTDILLHKLTNWPWSKLFWPYRWFRH